MLRETEINKHINQLVAAQSVIDKVQEESQSESSSLEKILKIIDEEDKTQSLKYKIQEAAVLRTEDPKIKSDIRNDPKKALFALQKIGLNDLSEILDEYRISPSSKGYKLCYQIDSFSIFHTIHRACSIVLSYLAFAALTHDKNRKVIHEKWAEIPATLKRFRQYLLDDPITNKYAARILKLDLSMIPRKTWRGLIVPIFNAGAYHDIGMCIISAMIESLGHHQVFKNRCPEKIPADAGEEPLNIENRVLSVNHEEIGHKYIMALTDGYGGNLYEDAVMHYQNSKISVFADLMNTAHEMAFKNIQKNRKTGVPSLEVFIDVITETRGVPPSFHNIIEELFNVFHIRLKQEEATSAG